MIEHDSGLSENEIGPPKFRNLFHPLQSSSDVESGIGNDESPHNRASPLPSIPPRQFSLEGNEIPTLERISLELNSVAVDWRSYHATLYCNCGLPFDSAQRKV